MASPWLFLLLPLCWTNSFSQSLSSNLSSLHMVKRELPSDSRDQADKMLSTVKDSLSLFKDMIEAVDTKKLSTVVKGLGSFARLAPGIGALASSIINMVLVFIPQDDPVLNEVKEGFAQVNRKLDSLSIQISNLATDVEWFNYASVYSQDEVSILNAWKKFNRFLKKTQSSQDNKKRQMNIFIRYAERVENSVDSLHHYLTVSGPSLSGNINDLLRKKFKCDVSVIGKYNLYFSSLLWKGMVLNQLYWSLIGSNSSEKEAEHTHMFKDVYTAQISAVKFCLDNYEQYMKKDVVEIALRDTSKPINKLTTAIHVKKALDEKYYWYSWVVLVYDTKNTHTTASKNYHFIHNMTEVPVETITVAVGYTQKAEEENKAEIRRELRRCYTEKLTTCEATEQVIPQCSREVGGVPVRQFVKVMHTSYQNNFAEVPEPLETLRCVWTMKISTPYNRGKVHIYYCRNSSVCDKDTCENGGECTRLLDSNEWLCECRDGYYGDRCEAEISITRAAGT